MLFLDGVGLGTSDAAVNPLCGARLPALRSLCGGDLPTLTSHSVASSTSTVIPLDANLGIEGLPQSGTGQTAIFTGVNGAQLIGKHFGPHPYSTLRPVIEEKNIFRQLLNAGKRPLFANAFPQRYFDYMSRHPSRMSVTSLSCTSAGMPLLRADDLRNGRGISADITSAGWADLGYPDMPVISPDEAGRRLVRLAEEYDFVLFEYWKTDHAGHAQDFEESIAVLEMFDGMLGGILQTLDSRTTLLFLTSDHGNIEDLSTKSHTRNPVPAIFHGTSHESAARKLRSTGDLTGIVPVLMEQIV
jgi:2,3-bisphosphoglycerate-independent phosphoglycerate mutase